MALAVQLAGSFAHYRFETWERHDRVDAVERLNFLDEFDARLFLRRLVHEQGELGLRDLLRALGPELHGHHYGPIHDTADVLDSLARALVRGHLVVTRIPRVPMVSDEPVYVEREPEREIWEPVPLDLDEPRAEAKLAFVPPTRVRAGIVREPTPRIVAQVSFKPTRVRARIGPNEQPGS